MEDAYISSRLLYRDALMLVVDKPAGLAVHPGPPGRPGPSLVDWLDALRFGLPRRPQLAHRLDRATSGCLVLGRHARALARLSGLFRTGEVEKSYWALVEGGPAEQEGVIDLPLARCSEDARDWRMKADPTGQPALTRFRVLGRGSTGEAPAAWLELNPVTGRTHQLRVHAAAAGWPIVGDAIYGRGRAGALMLHARRVGVPLYPKRPPVVVEAEPPPGFAESLRAVLDGSGGEERAAVLAVDRHLPDLAR